MNDKTQAHEKTENPKYSDNIGALAKAGRPAKKEEKTIDRSGHYDLDGASYSDAGVVIASTETKQSKKPAKK